MAKCSNGGHEEMLDVQCCDKLWNGEEDAEKWWKRHEICLQGEGAWDGEFVLSLSHTNQSKPSLKFTQLDPLQC